MKNVVYELTVEANCEYRRLHNCEDNFNLGTKRTEKFNIACDVKGRQREIESEMKKNRKRRSSEKRIKSSQYWL